MTVESRHFAEFESFRKITSSQELNLIKEQIENPNYLTGMDRLRAFYQMMGLDFDEKNLKILLMTALYRGFFHENDCDKCKSKKNLEHCRNHAGRPKGCRICRR